MATFTEEQQQTHRAAFINDCRQKAWNAACHAEWISTELDALLDQFTKLKEEDDRIETETKELEGAVDSHTKDNRDKRKTLQERRNVLAKQLETIGANHAQGQQALNGLYQSIEASLQLAKHAEKWEWKETISQTE
jgi:chromosome segregation ATPase